MGQTETTKKHPNIPGFVFLTTHNHCFDVLKKKTPQFEQLWDETSTVVAQTTGLESLEKQELSALIMETISNFRFRNKE